MATKYEKAAKELQPEPLNQKADPWLSLAQGVVYQAILDWRRLDNGCSVPRTNYESLRKFFRSAWCEQLLVYTGIHPSRILARLERHTREVKDE